MPVLDSPVARGRSFRPRLERLERRDTPTGAAGSLDYLRRVMDQYHDHFGVYEDVSSAGNHFHALGKIPGAAAAVTVNGSSTVRPHGGATAIRNTFDASPPGANFGGFYFLNGVLPDPGPPVNPLKPGLNFGTVPNAGVNLTGATALTFWARGQLGGEVIDFFMGGVGRDANTGQPTEQYPDSTPVVKISVTLSTEWRQYRIDLAGKDLSYVLGGFGWVADDTRNPSGAVFHTDDIRYELSTAAKAQRLNQPRLLRSYTTLDRQPNPFDANTDDDIDFVLRNTAFTYDSALAIQAFLADGTPDGLRRAKLLGDAFVYAAAHDRSFTDGRLRTAYAAGDIALPPGWTPNGRPGTTPVPGFYVDLGERFYEVEQTAVDTGNNAWAMLSLLALYRKTGQADYLTTARRIGQFILTQQGTTGTYRGFLGGVINPESNPAQRPYGSTEHNLDIYAAFTLMHQLTGEVVWRDGAAHAEAFVEAMWDAGRNCYLTGTIDPNTRNTNPDQLPLDVQAWGVLALPLTLARHPQVLGSTESNHRVTADGYTGFDFNADRDGVWAEGTGQMAVAYQVAGRKAAAAFYRQELRRLEQQLGGGAGVPATPRPDPAGLTTGFGFKYYQRLHVGATAWNVFAQTRYNPFTATYVSIPPRFAVAAAAGGGPHVKVIDPITNGVVREFFAYDPAFRGGVRVALGDVTGDGVPDVVTAAGAGGGPHVKVFDGVTGTEMWSFYAYHAGFTGGVFVAVADLDGDGFAEVITGAGSGGGPHVKAFDGESGVEVRSFYAFHPDFTGGVTVAAGDLDRDGRADIVVGAGAGGGPHVKAFDGLSGVEVRNFFAYDAGFTGGVNVAVGDLFGDGREEIITGAGFGGGPHVKVWGGMLPIEVRSFFASDAGFTGGVRLAARDLDGDDLADILTGAGPGGSPHVRAFRGDDGTELYGGFAFDPAHLGGVYVG